MLLMFILEIFKFPQLLPKELIKEQIVLQFFDLHIISRETLFTLMDFIIATIFLFSN